jgi:acetyltransferase
MSAGPDFSPRRAHTAKGREFLLRPIRPDDAPGLIEAFRLCDPEDLRLRFFSAISDLSETLAARLSHIDPDHEMAIVATEPAAASETIAGVVRLIYATPGEAAEYGVIVRSDVKKLGLGRLLMLAILDHAAAAGIRQVVGYVLTENRTMLRMARGLGATIERQKTDVTVMRVLFDMAATKPSPRGAVEGAT